MTAVDAAVHARDLRSVRSPRPASQTVDWEERVNPDRLRTYRLARARRPSPRRDLGAVLLFDFNNIRYVTSTHIGEWARDKMTRYALLTRGGEPHLWDFGSAAKHHRLYCPWLPPENIRGGMIGLRGAVAPEAGLFTRRRPRDRARSSATRASPTCRSASTSSSRRCSPRSRTRASSSATASR